jgi:hypothetical protein
MVGMLCDLKIRSHPSPSLGETKRRKSNPRKTKSTNGARSERTSASY